MVSLSSRQTGISKANSYQAQANAKSINDFSKECNKNKTQRQSTTMTYPHPLYPYVGPKEIAMYGSSDIVRVHVLSTKDILSWVHATNQQPDASGAILATYIVNEQAEWWLTDRSYEHVACAQGTPVTAAGEVGFWLENGSLDISYVSNQSTGYCPEPSSWSAWKEACLQTDIQPPDNWSVAFQFRRCPACKSIQLIKEEDWFCAICDTALPEQWNLLDERHQGHTKRPKT
jgi:hypothetical protein